jgi:8-oxo-dGTP pyrophosphatase MutT (NUDIX family)
VSQKSHAVAIVSLGINNETQGMPVLQKVKSSKTFGIMFSSKASDDPKLKLECYKAGARMVTNDFDALK